MTAAVAPPPPAKRMLLSDLDGTLLDGHSKLAPADRRTLEQAAANGVLRVVATGRSLYSARQVMPPDFPIDFLVFSSGAGVLDWRTQHLIRATVLEAESVRLASECLMAREHDFMLHLVVPDNHRFHYWRSRPDNHDFERRLARYARYAMPWPPDAGMLPGASQIVVVQRAHEAAAADALRELLRPLSVVRSTSPLDGRSPWTEIYAPGVSKAGAADWLARREGVAREATMAVGNDYNDADLLAWAGRGFVVANAVGELRARYEEVPSNDQAGVGQALRRWMHAGA